jgi:hypothetical protein
MLIARSEAKIAGINGGKSGIRTADGIENRQLTCLSIAGISRQADGFGAVAQMSAKTPARLMDG